MSYIEKDKKKKKINCVTKLYLSDKTNLKTFNKDYRKDTNSNEYYLNLLMTRNKFKSIKGFLSEDKNINRIYETLEAWGMNQRGAKLSDKNIFTCSIKDNTTKFVEIENLFKKWQRNKINTSKLLLELRNYKELFENLKITKTNSKLVTFSKLMHFLFLDYCMPIDRKNTLYFLLGNNYLSPEKEFQTYLNILESYLPILGDDKIKWEKYIDTIPETYTNSKDIQKQFWNTTPAKIIDNSIIWYLNYNCTASK